MERQVILQRTAGSGVFLFVIERTDIGMQKPMIHMNLKLELTKIHKIMLWLEKHKMS